MCLKAFLKSYLKFFPFQMRFPAMWTTLVNMEESVVEPCCAINVPVMWVTLEPTVKSKYC